MSDGQGLIGGPIANGGMAAQKPQSLFVPVAFVLSLMIPMIVTIGPLALMPHRMFLLLAFFPLLFQLVSGSFDRLRSIDWLIAFAALWAALSIFVNPGNGKIEASGIYIVEFFGAYLAGRVGIRSARGFAGFSGIYVAIVVCLVPFAIAEAVTGRAVLLELIPNSVEPAGSEPRWGLRRVQGPFNHAIIFGVFCAASLGIAWHYVRPNGKRIFAATAAFAGTFLSLSTGPLISFVTQLVFISWEAVTKAIISRWKLFAGLSVAGYVLLDLLSNRTPFHVLVSYASFNSGSAYARIIIFEHGMNNVYKHPLFGMGLMVGEWERPVWLSPSVDNFWLLTTMSYGVPCFLALFGGIVLLIRQIARTPIQDPLTRRLRAGYLTSLGGLLITAATVHYWHAMLAFMMFFVGSGVWLLNVSSNEVKTDAPAEDPSERAGLRFTRFDTERPPVSTRAVRPQQQPTRQAAAPRTRSHDVKKQQPRAGGQKFSRDRNDTIPE